MSYLHSTSSFDHGPFAGGDRAPHFAGEQSPNGPATDRAIDAALRSVPLPDGLMTRLGKLVYTVSDDAADQVDRLGC